MLIFGGGFDESMESLQGVGEIEVIRGVFGLQLDGTAIGFDRGGGIILVQLCVAEIVVSVGMIRMEAQQVEKAGFGFSEIAAVGE